ncbi:hypothetical protein BX616_005123 [Lobosporangium transversale]|nr:hypothetical protein BX616_005123 [Lobosporangium transversale]
MDTSSESTQPCSQWMRPTSPEDDIKQEDMAMSISMAMSSSPISTTTSMPLGIKQRPAPLKGSKSSATLRSVTAPHPLSMSTTHSLQHFQSTGNTMYNTPSASVGFTNGMSGNSSSSNPIFSPNTPIGPLSAPSSPSFPNAAAPNTAVPPSFLAMHGHNTSLYEPFRRNSVPILTADQAEHKRKASEEKHMQRQGSWSSLTPPSSMMGGSMNNVLGVPSPVLHHLDPATMHYYRTQFSHQHLLQQQHQHQQQLHVQQHSLNQVIPSVNSSNCSSPMPDSFISGGKSMNNNTQNGPNGGAGGSGGLSHHSTTGAIRGSSKVKRNNSICSTTSVSSTGSGSNNKHPCKFPSCEWSFKRYEHLKRHMLVHTKERPFQCDFTGCNKSFSRSDNFSAHLRTHSKKALARRYDNRSLESGGTNNNNTGDGGIKQESHDSSQTSSSSISSADQSTSTGMAPFMPHSSLHLSSGYNSNSVNQDASEYSRDHSPPTSPGDASSARPSSAMGTSSMNDDESFDMVGHPNYSFGNGPMYSLDHLDPLGNMVPRFDTIRLDLKSVAPADVHKYVEEGSSEGLMSTQNPNGESPRSSPMPQYDHFSFPTSISTHFMPVMSSGFSSESSNGLQQQHHHHHHQQHQHQQQHDALTSSSYSTDSFHHQAYHSDTDLKTLQFPHSMHSADPDLQYSPSPPSNEDSSHLHHPQPYHHTSYETKVAGNNSHMLHNHHGGYTSMPSTSVMPTHPLMSSMSSSSPVPVAGLTDPLSGSQVKAQRPMAKFQLKQQRQAQTA